MKFKHISVLYNESLNALNIDPEGIYVDCTAGGGGHSAGIAERLTTGRLIAIDQDPEAVETLNKRFENNDKVTVVHSNFEDIDAVLDSMDIHGSSALWRRYGRPDLQGNKCQSLGSGSKCQP